jgi:phosphoglycerate kinase
VAGFLVEKEVSSLEAAITKPERPLLVIVGGAKVDDKQPLIDKFLPIADAIAVGGKIAADGYKNADKKVYVAEDFATDADGLRLDIGPKSVREIENMIAEAKTIVWNGTMGKVEDEEFATGSLAVARMMGASKATTIIGGGDTVGFVEGLLEKEKGLEFNLLSTGGGASLELLSGKKLPGLEILQDK